MQKHTDEHIHYWAERFIAAGPTLGLTFGKFMDRTPDARAQMLERLEARQAAEQAAEGALPEGAGVHGDRIVAPTRHTRRWLRPWFYTRRERSRQAQLRRHHHGH